MQELLRLCSCVPLLSETPDDASELFKVTDRSVQALKRLESSPNPLNPLKCQAISVSDYLSFLGRLCRRTRHFPTIASARRPGPQSDWLQLGALPAGPFEAKHIILNFFCCCCNNRSPP